MSGPFKVSLYGNVGPGTREYILDLSGGADVAIPEGMRYFKSDVDTALKVKLVNGASSFTLPVLAGINVEAVETVYVSGGSPAATIVFFQ